MDAPTHVFIGVRNGEVFGICSTSESVAHWLDREAADFVQRVPIEMARTLLFQPWVGSAAMVAALSEAQP